MRQWKATPLRASQIRHRSNRRFFQRCFHHGSQHSSPLQGKNHITDTYFLPIFPYHHKSIFFSYFNLRYISWIIKYAGKISAPSNLSGQYMHSNIRSPNKVFWLPDIWWTVYQHWKERE